MALGLIHLSEFLAHNKRRNGRYTNRRNRLYLSEKAVNRERTSEEQTSGRWTLKSSLNFCLHSLASITLFTQGCINTKQAFLQ